VKSDGSMLFEREALRAVLVAQHMDEE
jgi:hypothetical protein